MRISVIIPVYNQARYLENAIKSVLIQVFTDYELIVVDDGSTDNCREVVAQFGNLVRYIWQENQGLAAARNTGIEAACGDMIALLDADDLWLPGFLEKMMQMVSLQPEAVVYCCRARCIDSDGRELPQLLGPSVVLFDDFYEKILRANSLIPSTILMRKSAVVAAGQFDVAYRRLQDWELWIRLLQEGHRFAFIPDILVHYRVHGTNLSTDVTGGQQAAMALAVKHFGPDDGQVQVWPKEKRLLYGGVYRYHLLNSVQGHGNRKTSVCYFRLALKCDPTLATDLDLFYSLAMGTQPPGYRGTPYHLDLEHNADNIVKMLGEVFNSPAPSGLKSLQQQALGTAYYGIGLLAYNTGQLALCRRYLVMTLRTDPTLRLNKRVLANLLKSFAGDKGLDWLRQARSVLDNLATL